MTPSGLPTRGPIFDLELAIGEWLTKRTIAHEEAFFLGLFIASIALDKEWRHVNAGDLQDFLSDLDAPAHIQEMARRL